MCSHNSQPLLSSTTVDMLPVDNPRAQKALNSRADGLRLEQDQRAAQFAVLLEMDGLDVAGFGAEHRVRLDGLVGAVEGDAD